MKKCVLIALLSLPMVTFASGTMTLWGTPGSRHYLLPKGTTKNKPLIIRFLQYNNYGKNRITLEVKLVPDLILAAKQGESLRKGKYSDAANATPGLPQLDLGVDDRGCNTVSGDFTIEAITWQPNKPLLSTLRASFHANCDGEVIDGTVQYHA